MTESTEKDLFEQIKNGNKSALELIYKKYSSALYYYSKKIVQNRSVAKDIVQDIFFKLWESRDSIIIQTSLSSYLYRMVYNNSLNYLKHQQIKDKHIHSIKEQIEIAGSAFAISGDHGQSIMIAKELDGQINAAIESLPEKCKEIFMLSRFENLKNHEIADRLNISLNTVQKQISIALKKLRIELSEQLKMF
jgi:RNA polymerase sigma-70 factor (ECF subfamily)